MSATPGFSLTVVGHVESALTDPRLAPKQGDEGAPDAWLVFDAAFREALRDLGAGDEVVVLSWLHRADRQTLAVHPRDDPSRPLTGVFGTRSADRPNPIGLHRVRIVAVDGLRLLVRGLEAVHGTPVLDLKPVLDRTSER
jgi:tRNA-Thr(GGU) m(6)t(6)A37 methyltransferase TsaA